MWRSLLSISFGVLCGSQALEGVCSERSEHYLEQPLPPTAQWVRQNETVGKGEKLHVLIALKQTNLDTLERLFWETSDPSHPSYGQYLTQQQVRSCAPTLATLQPSKFSTNAFLFLFLLLSMQGRSAHGPGPRVSCSC
jgi:hypothetical protein